ncbi:MAG: hypothetical protein OHK0039_31810 [Bacteroidia bacterium]
MRLYWLLPALMLLLPACETWTLRRAAEETFTLASADTGQRYELTVLLPPDYDPNGSYPSVYLIDGHWHYFNVAADALQLMEAGTIEPVIVIGIAYADLKPNGLGGYATISELRIDDLTEVKHRPEDERGGQAAAFRRFIAQDLIPRIESDYAADPAQRTLMGHSLGGYFGIWEMLTHRDSSLFTRIEAGSPALWWGDGHLMSLLDSTHAAGAALPFDLHTTMGSLESVVWNTFFDEFEARLESYAFDGLRYRFERYPKGHTANAEPGFRDGLLYFFGR